MIKPYLYVSALICLIFSLIFFNSEALKKTQADASGTPVVSATANDKPAKPSPVISPAKNPQYGNKDAEDLPTVISTLSSDDQLRKAQFTKELIQKYKKTRNLYLADPSMNTVDKQELIAQLDKVVFGDTQQDYEPSDEDLYEQARYREIIANFQDDTQSLKLNATLSRQQKEEEIRQLLSAFIEDIDG